MKFTEKEIEYFNYIQEHKLNVLLAFNKVIECETVKKMMPESCLKQLKVKMLTHDLSKYSYIEFESYRRTFFSINEQEKEKEKEYFEIAWQEHYSRNDHHPEYWKKNKKQMTYLALIEMITDWTAMSLKFNNTPLEFFLGKKKTLTEEFGEFVDYKLVEQILKELEEQFDD